MIQSKIVAGILADFQKDFNLGHLSETDAFENLINFLVVSKIHPEAFDDVSRIEDVSVDEGQNFGIDGVAILVNDTLITNKEDIDILRRSKNLDIHFIFTQSKTSNTFDSGDMLKFITGVKNFFSTNPEIPLNQEIEFLRTLKDHVFSRENARFFNSKSPYCSLFYATTGKPTQDTTIFAVAKQGEKDIASNVPDLRKVNFKLIDIDFIIDTTKEIENSEEVDVSFNNDIISLGKINGVEQSYIGFLKANEFLKLITNKEGGLRRNLFYENVRDFQGIDNSVNQEISSSITDISLQDKFVLLNNGATIVTKHLRPLGNGEFELRDFQIVNGCQTSHIIFRNKGNISIDNNLRLPVKIIHTNNSDVITRIIKATNRQSPVPTEAFITLDKFHKDLQIFYEKIIRDAPESTFYERRSREFSNVEPKPEKVRVINLHTQIRSYCAMFLNKPQVISYQNPSTIYLENKTKMFLQGHSYYPYYVSSYTLFLISKLLNDKKIPAKYSKYRYYLLLSFRIKVAEIDCGLPNSAQMDKYCKSLLNILWDETKFQATISDCTDVIEKSLNNMNVNRYSRDTLQLDKFVSEVISQSQLSNRTKPVS